MVLTIARGKPAHLRNSSKRKRSKPGKPSRSKVGRSTLLPRKRRDARKKAIEYKEPLSWASEQISKGIAPKARVIADSLMRWAKQHFDDNLYQTPSLFHRWVSQNFKDFHKKRGQKVCIVAPRGNAKSTWITLIYVTLCALEGWEPYIVIVSDSATQARLLLSGIKEAIEFSRELRKSYPNTAGKGPMWQQGRIRLRNGVLIEAIGTRMKIRGRRKGKHRPSLIVIDDPQNDENIESGAQRAKAQSWLDKAVIPAGNKRTNIVMVGTALHRQSLVMAALQNPGWRGHLFRSIISWPVRMDLWRKWEALYCDKSNPNREERAQRFYERNKAALHKGAKVLWKQEESLLDLMKLRLLVGYTSFESEKQNNPRKPDTVEFPDEYFGSYIWTPQRLWPDQAHLNLKVISIDPSKGKSAKKGDYSAINMLGRSADDLIYCQCDMARRPVTKIIADAVNHAEWFQPDAIAIEANQFQELMCEPLLDALDERGLAYIPVYPINNQVNKAVRIRRLGGRLARRELRFMKGHRGTKMLVEQLEDFPTGEHDDGPDSLEMGIRLMIDLDHDDEFADYLDDNLLAHIGGAHA